MTQVVLDKWFPLTLDASLVLPMAAELRVGLGLQLELRLAELQGVGRHHHGASHVSG